MGNKCASRDRCAVAELFVILLVEIFNRVFSVTVCDVLYYWQKCISHLPDKILIEVFSYLRLSDVCRLARVCKAWRLLAYDGRLWTRVSLRPDFNGLHVHNIDALVALISARFGATLRYIELSADLITPAVLHELANRFAVALP